MSVLTKNIYPNEISGLYGWWDASDFNNSTAGTAIDIWQDKSGNGFDFIHNPRVFPLAVPPSTKQVSNNGNSILSGSGKYDCTIPLSDNLPFTIFHVYKFNSIATTPTVVGGLFGESILTPYFDTGSGLNRFIIGGGITNMNTQTDASYISLLSAVISNISSQRIVRNNGINYTVNAGPINNISKQFLNYRQANIEASSGIGNISHYERIIYNRILSLQEIKLIERYLKFKWSL